MLTEKQNKEFLEQVKSTKKEIDEEKKRFTDEDSKYKALNQKLMQSETQFKS